MVLHVGDIVDKLETIETTDEVVLDVVERTRDLVTRSGYVDGIAGLRIFVCDFTKADADMRKSTLFTESCKVILTVPAVVINDRFLMEVEAALRSFDMSDSFLDSQYLRSDEDMFGLVERIGSAPERYLDRLRKFGRAHRKGVKEDDQSVVDELTMATFFFVSHEIGHLLSGKGHLLSGKDQMNYGTFLGHDAELEHRIENAVFKLGRHADDFIEHGFNLEIAPGIDWLDSSDIRRVEEELRERFERNHVELCVNHTIWFEVEKLADEKATEIVISHLDAISRRDKVAAERQQYLMIKALFVVAIYSWYKDLHIFTSKLGTGWTGNARMLMHAMVKNREQYIHAASLFGNDHRFTLLRATLTIKSILEARTTWADIWADQDEGELSSTWFWFSRKVSGRPSDQDDLRKWWLSECLQRHHLLCISMDTAVKMAYIGRSTGWLKKGDIEQGTFKPFGMEFESIGQAVQRLYGRPPESYLMDYIQMWSGSGTDYIE